jgi:hypothetical protein
MQEWAAIGMFATETHRRRYWTNIHRAERAKAPVSADAKLTAAEYLFNLDTAAWPVRRLRLYPAGAAQLRCNAGSVLQKHTVMESVDEVVTFSGTDSASLDNVVGAVVLQLEGRAYDLKGAQVSDPGLRFADGTVTTTTPVFALVRVRYQTSYQVVQLTVTEGGEFDVLVSAYRGDEATSATVSFEPVEFEPKEDPVVIGAAGFTMHMNGPWDYAQQPQRNWPEVSRTTSTVIVGGVSILRIETATFRDDDGGTVTLQFNNSGN